MSVNERALRDREAHRGFLGRTLLLASGMLGLFLLTGATNVVDMSDEATCLTYVDGGCPDPEGELTCLVEPTSESGWTYWPPRQVDGAMCADSCPNAHCHGEEPDGGSTELALVLERRDALRSLIERALNEADAVELVQLARHAPEVTINFDRQAVQLIETCRRKAVIAHYPIAPEYLAEVKTEHIEVPAFMHVVKALGLRLRPLGQ